MKEKDLDTCDLFLHKLIQSKLIAKFDMLSML